MCRQLMLGLLIFSSYTCNVFVSMCSLYCTAKLSCYNKRHIRGNVDCDGQEAGLSECGYHTRGVRDCSGRYEKAGVICNSKIIFHHSMSAVRLMLDW